MGRYDTLHEPKVLFTYSAFIRKLPQTELPHILANRTRQINKHMGGGGGFLTFVLNREKIKKFF